MSFFNVLVKFIYSLFTAKNETLRDGHYSMIVEAACCLTSYFWRNHLVHKLFNQWWCPKRQSLEDFFFSRFLKYVTRSFCHYLIVYVQWGSMTGRNGEGKLVSLCYSTMSGKGLGVSVNSIRKTY